MPLGCVRRFRLRTRLGGSFHHSVSGPRHIERIHLEERVGRLTGSWRSSGKVTLVVRDEGDSHASGSNLRNWPMASVCNWHTRGSLTLSMPAISR